MALSLAKHLSWETFSLFLTIFFPGFSNGVQPPMRALGLLSSPPRGKMGCSGSPGSHTWIKVPQDTPETLILTFLPGLWLWLRRKGHFSSPCLNDILTEQQEQARGKALGLLTWTQVVASASFSGRGNCSNPGPTHDIIHDWPFLAGYFCLQGGF